MARIWRVFGLYLTRSFCLCDKGLWISVNTNQRNHVCAGFTIQHSDSGKTGKLGSRDLRSWLIWFEEHCFKKQWHEIRTNRASGRRESVSNTFPKAENCSRHCEPSGRVGKSSFVVRLMELNDFVERGTCAVFVLPWRRGVFISH
jgi:hypothetical protein